MSTMLVWLMVLSLLGQPVISLEQSTSKMEKNLMSLLKMQHRLSSANEEPTNQRPGTQVKHDVNPSVKISNIVQETANTSQDHPRMSGSQESAVRNKLSSQVKSDGEKLLRNNRSRSSDNHSMKRYDYMDYLGDHTGKRNQHDDDSHDSSSFSTITAQSFNKVRTVGQKIEANGLTDKHRTKRSPLDYLDYLGLHDFKRGGQNNHDYLDYLHDDGGTGKRDAQNYIDYIDHNIHTRNGHNKIATRSGSIDDHYMDYIDHDVHKRSENQYLDYLQASKRDASNYMDYLASDKRSENHYLDYLQAIKRDVNKYRDNPDHDTWKRNEHHYLDYLQASKRYANNYMDYLDRASSKRSENQYLDDLLNAKRNAIKYMDFLDHDTKKRNEPHYLQASKRYDMNHGDYLDHYVDYLQIQAAAAETSTEVPPMDYLNAQKRNERHYMDYLQAKKRNDKLPVDYINVNTGKRESHKNRDYIDSDQPYQRDTRGFMTDFTDYLDNLDTGKGNDDLFGDDDDDIII